MTSACRGLTLVELMVGLAIGLIVVAAATTFLNLQLHDTRRLQLAARLDQDLRAALDLLARDLRRSGHVPQGAGPATAGAGYADVVVDAGVLRYAVARGGPAAPTGTVPPADRAGARLEQGVLRLLVGEAGWQALTDPAALRVTRLDAAIQTRVLPLAAYCDTSCPPPAGGACPAQLQQREVRLSISAFASADPSIVRTVSTHVALRNDRIAGSCAP